MSTIHDALKKVQDDMNPQDSSSELPQKTIPPRQNPFNAPPAPPQEPPAVQENEEDKPQKKKIKILAIILIILAVAALGTALMLFKDSLRLPDLPSLKLPFKTQSPAKSPALAKAPEPKLQYGMHFKGIMSINKKNVAMIGDGIYEAGDTIEGETIKRITKNEVILVTEEGIERTLKISK